MPELPEPKHRPISPRISRSPGTPLTPSPGTPGEGRGGGLRLSLTSPYAELDLTTNYSFLRGASHPDELISTAASLGYSAVAVTDLNSLAGVVRAHVAAKEFRIPLCVGCRLRFTDAPDVLVWAENRAGYANLCRMLTTGKRRAEKGQCLLKLEDLLNAPAGLSAALVPQRIDPENTANPPLPQTIGPLRDAFAGRLSLAISRLYGSSGPDEQHLQTISRDFAVPLLATNQVHYHHPERRTLQDVLTCIRHGCSIHQAGWRLFPNGERHLKSPHQMQSLFSDLPQALRRTVEIAERCTFSLDELRYEYPDEVVPPGQTAGSYLAELAWTGAAQRYPAGIPAKVRRQIEHELTLIAQLKIEAYFLTVYDLVHFARGRRILCQGRGSAANSAVCYCIGVTSVDPARIDVLFERFVSAARDEPPDIDIDFEHERREEVIQYIYDKYGRDRAGMTAEVITYRGRSAVRDVGKALGLGLDAVDSLAKRLEGWHAAAPLDDQIAAAGIDPTDSTIRLVVSLTRELLGFPRHLSQHVGGMVMTRGSLHELVPIENASMADRTVIEWDKNDIDALGILKVDVLALGMLTAISKALTLLNSPLLSPSPGIPGEGWGGGSSAVPQNMATPPTGLSDGGRVHPPYELHTIPAEDPIVYDMICDADTVGVFQIESRAQMSMLPRLKPRCFYDLVIEVAIVRPGPIQGDMVHPYLRRRAGLEEVSFPKPELEAVLGKTLGVPLFQEQAMRVAMVAAGFSAGEADQLRRAMAAWRRSGAIEFFHAKIVDGMLANGYEREFAERCFNQIKGFGEYGFPESHAASFALLVYASAWIKRYHPAAFCCALLNSQPMGFYAPAQLVRDARDHGVNVRPVDVNHSEWDCTLEELTPASPSAHASPSLGTPGEGRGGGLRPALPPALRLGFRMIRGLHETHGRRIAACRAQSGPFQSVDHFHETTSLPVAAIRRLSEADAFSSLPMTRRIALWETLALPTERPELQSPTKDHASALPAPLLPLQTKGQEIRADYRTLGLSLKGHPVALIRQFLARRKIIPAARVWDHPHGSWIKVAGLVLVRQRPGTAGGIVFATLEDETGIVNLIIRPDVYDRYRDAARHAALLQAEGYLQREGKVQHLLAAKMIDLSEALSDCATRSRDFR